MTFFEFLTDAPSPMPFYAPLINVGSDVVIIDNNIGITEWCHIRPYVHRRGKVIKVYSSRHILYACVKFDDGTQKWFSANCLDIERKDLN